MDWSAFGRVVLVGALQALAVAMVVPVRPKLLLDALGGSASRAAALTGGLSTLDAVVEAVSNPALGHVSDLHGRRGVLLLAQAGLVADLLRWLGATVAASGVATGGLGSMLFFYTHTRFGWGPPETGRFLSAVGVSMILSQGVLARPAVAVLGERPLILAGYALKATHLVLYGAAPSGGAMYGALGVATLGYAAGPAWKGLLARQVGPDEQGALQGGLAALSTIVQPVAPLVATGLFGFFAPRGLPGVPLYVMAALTVGAGAIAAKALAHPQLR
ncbi:hypothetical protein I4F81_010532 [Pyropia yezoensis]|uniref:Uncharacterized protein n=1 Tax=Pyropia yezoensis TaxID=2788 RepID=A0ACC3CCQ9_PYRYE|nr:hypothetical protein I4F81_010532 [Neopyropia yezoensis]